MIGHPELAKNPLHLVSMQRITDADELDKVLVPAFKTKTKGYWLDEGQRLRIPMAPAPDLKELLETPHWRQRGSFEAVDGGAVVVGDAAHAGPASQPNIGLRRSRNSTGPSSSPSASRRLR